MTRRSAFALVALACVDLGAGGRFLERGFSAMGPLVLTFSGFFAAVTLTLLVPGVLTFLSAIAVHATRLGRSGVLRVILSTVHVGVGAFLVVGGAGSGLLVGGTEIPMADWFLIAPGLALLIAGSLPLILLRTRA